VTARLTLAGLGTTALVTSVTCTFLDLEAERRAAAAQALPAEPGLAALAALVRLLARVAARQWLCDPPADPSPAPRDDGADPPRPETPDVSGSS